MSEPPCIPPAPEARSISPAPEDFASPPPVAALLWPLLWLGIAMALWLGVCAVGWPPFPG